MSKFQVGDKIKIEATVSALYANGTTIDLVFKDKNLYVIRSATLISNMELVERPKKKVKAWKVYFDDRKDNIRCVSLNYYQSKQHFDSRNGDRNNPLTFLMLLDAEGCEFEWQDEIGEDK